MTNTTTGSVSVVPLKPSVGLRDRVSEQLLVAILNGVLQAGDRLIGQQLAALLGVSATAVREALIELATFGFVELLPNRGAICREFGLAELRDIVQVRRILEAEATFDVCSHLPVEQIKTLRKRLLQLSRTVETDPEWSDHAISADLELHEIILQSCRNRQLALEIERYNFLMRAIRRAAGNLYNVQLRAVSEHLKIIKAFLVEDAELARKRMTEHIESTARGFAKVMFQRRGK